MFLFSPKLGQVSKGPFYQGSEKANQNQPQDLWRAADLPLKFNFIINLHLVTKTRDCLIFTWVFRFNRTFHREHSKNALLRQQSKSPVASPVQTYILPRDGWHKIIVEYYKLLDKREGRWL